MKNVVILGSTGSIGASALSVLADMPDRFRVAGLSARGNWRRLGEQAERWRPRAVAVESEKAGESLKKRLRGRGAPEVFAGGGAAARMAAMSGADIVLNGISGFAGLSPTLRALEGGKTVALANKESLVAAGALVTATARRGGGRIIPVDSEHSAIFQCLRGARKREVSGLILTASGGALLNRKKNGRVTPAQVLRHPRWEMGRRITVDSATLMNKGMEMIEAHWLFGVPYEMIHVVIHPESVVHSLVEFCDGALIAQLAAADMRIPIRYALTHPERGVAGDELRLDFDSVRSLKFMPAPEKRFPCLGLARRAGVAGGLLPAVLNAADEVAVDAFLRGKLPFDAIEGVVEGTLETMERDALGASVMNEDEISRVDAESRAKAKNIIRKMTAK